MKVYKLLQRRGKKLLSYNIAPNTIEPDGIVALEYFKQKATVPKVGALFAFSNLKAAKAWMSPRASSGAAEIWKCFGVRSSLPVPTHVFTSFYPVSVSPRALEAVVEEARKDLLYRLEGFWEFYDASPEDMEVPKGTVVCSLIIPQERIA